MAAFALGLASAAPAALLEIEIRATGLALLVESADPSASYDGVSLIAVGTYHSGDVTEVDPGLGPVGFVPVDLDITFGGVGSFTTIGLGVWDLDDPEHPFPSLLISDAAIAGGFLLATDPSPGDLGFDLSQPFALVSFPLVSVLSGPFATTSGHTLTVSCGGGDAECAGRFSVEIREAAIPEPAGALLFAVGLGVTGARLRRR
jgi:hypothetical protein